VLDYNPMNEGEINVSKDKQQDTSMEEGQKGFEMISRFDPKSNQHILRMGFVLSKGHPLLADEKGLKELREKTKARWLDVDIDKVSNCQN
jgi:hypothetical protein